MPNSWEEYRKWKDRQKEAKKRIAESVSTYNEDDVSDLTEWFKEYSDL